MKELEKILKYKDILLPTQVKNSHTIVFLITKYGC